MLFVTPLVISVGEGKSLEEELNSTGPGEAFFVQCDLSKEDEIKVYFGQILKSYTQQTLL